MYSLDRPWLPLSIHQFTPISTKLHDDVLKEYYQLNQHPECTEGCKANKSGIFTDIKGHKCMEAWIREKLC